MNVVNSFDVEDLRKDDAEIIREVHVEGKYYTPEKDFLDLKEPCFLLDLADSLKAKTPEKMNHLSEKARRGGMYEKCFESGCHCSCERQRQRHILCQPHLVTRGAIQFLLDNN